MMHGIHTQARIIVILALLLQLPGARKLLQPGRPGRARPGLGLGAVHSMGVGGLVEGIAVATELGR